MEKPEPPPEGRLLKSAMDAQGRSIRDVARRLSISEARVRNILNGYQSAGRGQTVKVVAPTSRLAGMAFNLRVTPDQLRKAGRADAAEYMERMERESEALEQEFESWQAWAERPWETPVPPQLLKEITDEDLIGELSRRLLGPAASVSPPFKLEVAARDEGRPSRKRELTGAQDVDAEQGDIDPG